MNPEGRKIATARNQLAGRSSAVHGRRVVRVVFAIAFVVLAAAGCRTQGIPIIPPVVETPTHETRVGKWVWADLVTQDVAHAKAFYGALFGWQFEGDSHYTRIIHDGRAIGGMLPAQQEERRSEWIGNLSVANVDEAARVVVEQGGVIETGPVDAPDRGRIALATDSEGAALLLLRATTGDPPDREPSIGSFLWWEIWSHDVDAAARFYGALVGYEAEVHELEGQGYVVLMDGEVPRAGVVAAPERVNPLWLPYVRVLDPPGLAARARSLGARVVAEDERSAIFVDPTGAPIGIQAWDFPESSGRESVQ